MPGLAATPVQLPDLMNAFADLAGAWLFLLVLWALIHCFLGCVVFRALLIGNALLAGVIVSCFLLGTFRTAPGGLDYFVASTAGAVLLGLGAWFAGRGTFALLVAISVAAVALAAGWILGIIAGIAAFVVAYAYFRRVAILAGAIDGAAVAVFAVVAMFLGSENRMWDHVLGSQRQTGPVLILLAFIVALAVAGGYIQTKLLELIRTSLTPEHILRSGKRARRNRSTVRPRFSKL